jgi:hypothetical protein
VFAPEHAPAGVEMFISNLFVDIVSRLGQVGWKRVKDANFMVGQSDPVAIRETVLTMVQT